MVERPRGAVLNIASAGAFQPLPGQAGYGAAKAFVLSYTESLHRELRGTGVTACVLCPGPVDTGFGERAGFSKEDAVASLPSFMWETAESVARVGVDALDKDRVVAIPGAGNRAPSGSHACYPTGSLPPWWPRTIRGYATDGAERRS